MNPSFSALLRRLPRPALCLCALTLFVLAAPLCRAATYYISPSGSDTNPGTQTAPFLTIQNGISTSVNGDTVIVEDGTYTGPGNVDLDFGGRNITVTSQNGPATTIIECQGTSSAYHRGFYLHSGETNAVISGLTIQNGFANGGGGGIYNSTVGLTVQSCIIKGNTALGYDGGGGICNINNAIVAVTNCVLVANTAFYGGGGIANFTQFNGAVTLTNCTLTGNAAGYDGESAAGSFVLINDILYGDMGGEIGRYAGSASHCDIQGGLPSGVTDNGGNINSNPLFYNSPSDLHLQSSSPCLGAGTANGAPVTALDGQRRLNPPSIGAYEVALTGSTATTTSLSSSLNPSTFGQSVTFMATVVGAGGTPTGVVNFIIDGAFQASVALTAGQAAFSTSSLTGGSHTITASYSGDAVYSPNVLPALTQRVTQVSTTTALISSLNPSTFGQSVTFTATVTGSSPTGTVTFMDTTSGTTLGTGTLSGGTVALTISSLAVGSHQIVASYSGDINNSASASTLFKQTVNPVSTTIFLTSSLNPSLFSQIITFTATVTGATSMATGTVTFTIDGVALTSATISKGSASYSTSTLPVGSHIITVTYTGDANFSSSTSSALTQIVQPHLTSQYVSLSGRDSNPGTAALPKLTIQAAMNATISGDTVIVENGTYTGPGNVDSGLRRPQHHGDLPGWPCHDDYRLPGKCGGQPSRLLPRQSRNQHRYQRTDD